MLDPAFVKMVEINFINFLTIGNVEKNQKVSVIDTDIPIVFHDLTRRGVTKSLFESVISEQIFGRDLVPQLNYLHLDKKVFTYVSDELQRPKWDNFNIKEKDEEFIIFPEKLSLAETIRFDIKEFPMVAEFRVKIMNMENDDIMLSLLQRYLKPHCFIPYELNERKQMFPDAFKALEEYM